MARVDLPQGSRFHRRAPKSHQDALGLLGSKMDLAEAINQILPQTQCTRCGYPACKPYAQAIAHGLADINRCPPGGQKGIEALSQLTGQNAKPLDPNCGEEQSLRFAWVVAEDCIGCTKCIVACPVDAILGGPQRLHAVIAERCTGCELCLPPCPVDCIEMRPWQPERMWTAADAKEARIRFEHRTERIRRQEEEGLRYQLEKAHVKRQSDAASTPRARAIIDAAIARAKERQDRLNKGASTSHE